MLCSAFHMTLSSFFTLFLSLPLTYIYMCTHSYCQQYSGWPCLKLLISLQPVPQGSVSEFELPQWSPRDYVMQAALHCTCTPYANTKYTQSPKPTYGGDEVSLLIYSWFSRNIKEENRESTHETGLKYCFGVQWPDFSLIEALSFNVTKSPQTDATLSVPHHLTFQFPRHQPVTHMLTLKR